MFIFSWHFFDVGFITIEFVMNPTTTKDVSFPYGQFQNNIQQKFK